jgi:hypothetical protein
MTDINIKDIQTYIEDVINTDALLVSDVAPIAAQTAADLANLGMPNQSPMSMWLELIPAFREKSIKYGLSVKLATYLSLYDGTTKTAVEVLQEIINENTV